MVIGLSAGALFALATVIMDIAMELPAYQAGLRVVFLAPYISNFLQFVFSALWLAVFLRGRERRGEAFSCVKSGGGRMVLLSSLLGGPVGMSAYVAAVHYAGPALASAVSALFPAVGALLARVLLKERLRKVQVLGLSVSVTGVALLGLGYGPEGGKNVPLGFVFALICCVSWALETVLFSWGIRRTGLTLGQALLLRQTVSAAACGGIILPLLRGWEETLSVLPDKATLYIFAGALFFTASYLCYYRAIVTVGAAKAMALNITYAAWSIVFSLLLLHLIPSIESVLCSVLIAGGSLAASASKGGRETPPPGPA